MAKRKQNVSVNVVARGAAPEREVVQKKLMKQDGVWSGEGMLVRECNGAKTFLWGSTLKYFLEHVKDGVPFTEGSIPMNDDFSSYSFDMVLSWLLRNDLCIENDSGYTVSNRVFVRAIWNTVVDSMKL